MKKQIYTIEDVKQNKTRFKKLNLGSGYEYMQDAINIDIAKEVKPDLILDVEKGLPFEDNTFEYIYSSHTLEHITPQNWRFVLSEISRVAKNNCILDLRLPFDNTNNRTNHDHFRTFGFGSFKQLEIGNRRNYYNPLTLERLHKEPNTLTKAFYYMFPFLKHEVRYKFKIKK